MIWAKEETLPREEIERIQLTKLKDTVRYIYDRVKPYREKMDMACLLYTSDAADE